MEPETHPFAKETHVNPCLVGGFNPPEKII